MKTRRSWTLIPILLLSAAVEAQTQKQKNLSTETAYVRASGESARHRAANAADGSADSYWECSGSSAATCWIEFGWKDPVSIRELVVRRYPARREAKEVTNFEAEVFANGSWHKLASSGDGKSALPMAIYLRVPPTAASQFRISNLDGDARIQEIALYAQNTPPWIDVRGDDRGDAIGIVTDGFGAGGLRAKVQASARTGGKPWS